MINFELYKVFYQVASSLSFSQAAQNLFLTQSAVSQNIKVLEQKLNVRLLYRNTKQVRLTTEGELLFKHIEQAYHLIMAGERAVEELQSLTTGQLNIAASDTICKYYLLPYFQQFMKLYPKIKISVTNRTSPKCVELLHKGAVDVSIVNIPEVPGYHDVAVTKLKTIHDVFVAADKFSELKTGKTTLAQLAGYPLLMLEKHTITRQYFDDLAKQYHVSLCPEVELGSLDLVIELAKIGLGIAFVPKEYVEHELDNHALFKINLAEPIHARHLGIITHKKIPLPRTAKSFIQLLH